MSDELKTRQKALQEAIRVLESKNQEIRLLYEKKRQFDMGDLSTAEESKTIRKKTLIDFILGRVTKDEVNAANEAVFKAERDGKFQEEMAMTIDDVLKKMEAQIPNLQKAIESAKGELWEGIYEKLKQEAQVKVGDLPVRAMAAGSRRGQPYQATLLDLFGNGGGPSPSISFISIDEAAKKLAKEYGLDD